MLRDAIGRGTSWLRRAVTEPVAELNRWQLAARFAYDLGRYGARQLQEDRAEQMAAALAYRTLFALAPVLVVTTVLVKTIRGPEAIMESVHGLLIEVGLDQFRVAAATDLDAEAADTTVLSLADWLEDLIGQLVRTDLSAIGWVGLAVIVYAAISLMVTIEDSFNIIYRAPGGRKWIYRVPLYWFILTVSPVIVGIGSVADNAITHWISTVHTWQWLLLTTQAVWSFCLLWLLMFAIYALLPNSKVHLRHDLTGSFVAALLLSFGQKTLGAYLGSAFSVNQLYGALGLVPLFMLWVYLMWLAVLFGLQVSATLQGLHGRSPEELDVTHMRTGMVDPASVLSVMEVIAERFRDSQATSSQQVTDETCIPEPVVASVFERLVQLGWLHRVENRDSAVVLAKPPEQIDADGLLTLAFQLADQGHPGRRPPIVQEMREAQQSVVAGVTLAKLLDKHREARQHRLECDPLQ